MNRLFEPLRAGDLRLAQHRVVMAPLTRQRASVGRVPNDLMASSTTPSAPGAGMILTEATAVTPQGVGYADTPGLCVD